LTTEREQKLGMAGRTPESRKPALQAAAVEEGLYRATHDGTKRSVSRLEAFLVRVEVARKVLVEESVECRTLRMPWSVDAESHFLRPPLLPYLPQTFPESKEAQAECLLGVGRYRFIRFN
jgi:hypothetical protein